MTTQQQLRKDILSFMVLRDFYPSDLGEPICPLCLGEHDYTGLSEEEVNKAWEEAANEYNRVWGSRDLSLEQNAFEDAWRGLGCEQDWRGLWTRLNQDRQARRAQEVQRKAAQQGE